MMKKIGEYMSSMSDTDSNVRLVWTVVIVLAIQMVSGTTVCGQVPKDLFNGGFEKLDEEGRPESWLMFGRNDEERAERGVQYSVSQENPYAGQNCFAIDALDLEQQGVSAVQYVSAENYAGKRIRLKASIRGIPVPKDLEEEELENYGQAYLSIEIFRTDDSGDWRTMAAESAMKGFARDPNWHNHFIVIDVPQNAENILVSLTAQKKTKAWFDEVRLEVVPEQVELTSPSVFDEPQPFFNWWLLLPAFVIPIFCLAFLGDSKIHGIALRFTVAYWGIYFLTWWLLLISFTEIDYSDYFIARNGIVNWFGWNVFEADLFRFGSGSGDTLFNYTELFSILILSTAITVFWCCVDWRKTDYAWLRDGFRSFLRYSLAFVLLGYGLAKLNPETSQFQAPSFDRLAVSYGESSPMGLLWTFMGASQPYSVFAGAGEVVAALLLIWRRTAILGAFVSIGVMTNVVMLNLCYDVPVKLLSSHLLLTGVLILMADLRWIGNAFIFHRSTERNELFPPYANAKSIWAFRGLQALIILLGIIFPTWEAIDGWVDARHPACFGEYFVEEYKSPFRVADQDANDDDSDSSTQEAGLKKITLQRVPFPLDPEQEESFTDVIGVMSDVGGEDYRATVAFDSEKMTIEVLEFQGRKQLLPDVVQVRVIDDDHIELRGKMGGGDWSVKLRRRQEEFLLTSRGFHWVSQRPFSR